jgi:hypothetical protein
MSTDLSLMGRTLVGISLAAGCCTTVYANDIHVCATCAHKTIQSAVNDAASTDRVYVADGRYVENVTVTGKALEILGVPGRTFVVAAGRGPVFTLGSSTSEPNGPYPIHMKDLYITGGNHFGGTEQGGGVQVRPGAYLFLSNSTLTGNHAASGGGISITGDPAHLGDPAYQTTISDCYIHNNTATVTGSAGGTGGGVAVQTGRVLIENSSITENQANEGGGVYEAPAAFHLQINGSYINLNTAGSWEQPTGRGGGISAYSGLSTTALMVAQNWAHGPDGGGGLYFNFNGSSAFGGESWILGATIVGNSVETQDEAGGMMLTGSKATPLMINDTYVIANSGAGVVNRLIINASNFLVVNNAFAQCVGGNGCPN